MLILMPNHGQQRVFPFILILLIPCAARLSNVLWNIPSQQSADFLSAPREQTVYFQLCYFLSRVFFFQCSGYNRQKISLMPTIRSFSYHTNNLFLRRLLMVVCHYTMLLKKKNNQKTELPSWFYRKYLNLNFPKIYYHLDNLETAHEVLKI